VDLFKWTPTVVALVSLVGVGFVVNSTVNRHEGELADLRDDVQDLKTKVAVLEATRKGGE
jgi:hypothetical protein